MSDFICSRCGATENKYIGVKPNGEKYCRRCISFRGEDAKEPFHKKGLTLLKIDYPLSKEQEQISKQVIENFKNGVDTLINAVCGAGKTELVFGVMAYALSKSMNVGFAIPRRDVVHELFLRIKYAFPSNSVCEVYGGNTSKLSADIIVLTTHQLYRYESFFDLLILDEIDAFPYNNNELLIEMYRRSLRGHSVVMSATPSISVVNYYMQQGRQILKLNTRFHHHPLPVPQLLIRPSFFKFFTIVNSLKNFIKSEKPVFVFTPTIDICEETYCLISKVIKGGSFVHSKCSDRQQKIQNFREGKYKYLVTTAVLERGVTVKDLQVIVFKSDHKLYDEFALVQISGRVGRKYDAPKGEVIFIADKETPAIKNAIETIRRKNESL